MSFVECAGCPHSAVTHADSRPAQALRQPSLLRALLRGLQKFDRLSSWWVEAGWRNLAARDCLRWRHEEEVD
jgi:hypothetical protein